MVVVSAPNTLHRVSVNLFLVFYIWGPVVVDVRHRFHAPGLGSSAFGPRPSINAHIRALTQASRGISEFDAITARFPNIKEEGLVDRVFIRAIFNVNAFFKEEVRGLENIFTGVSGKGQVMESAT